MIRLDLHQPRRQPRRRPRARRFRPDHRRLERVDPRPVGSAHVDEHRPLRPQPTRLDRQRVADPRRPRRHVDRHRPREADEAKLPRRDRRRLRAVVPRARRRGLAAPLSAAPVAAPPFSAPSFPAPPFSAPIFPRGLFPGTALLRALVPGTALPRALFPGDALLCAALPLRTCPLRHVLGARSLLHLPPTTCPSHQPAPAPRSGPRRWRAARRCGPARRRRSRRGSPPPARRGSALCGPNSPSSRRTSTGPRWGFPSGSVTRATSAFSKPAASRPSGRGTMRSFSGCDSVSSAYFSSNPSPSASRVGARATRPARPRPPRGTGRAPRSPARAGPGPEPTRGRQAALRRPHGGRVAQRPERCALLPAAQRHLDLRVRHRLPVAVEHLHAGRHRLAGDPLRLDLHDRRVRHVPARDRKRCEEGRAHPDRRADHGQQVDEA